MSVHLLKLCVGAETVDHLFDWRERILKERKRQKQSAHMSHTTRMWPRREEELLKGGSLYWVVKGQILVRQEIHALEETFGTDGIRRCRILLVPELILTEAMPRRPFQGWRYLKAEDAPKDLKAGATQIEAELAADLSQLGLI